MLVSIEQENGKAKTGPDLSVTHHSGLVLPNPFVIGSGPPGTNYAVMKKAFQEGWGAVIAKTVSMDSSKASAARTHFDKNLLQDKNCIYVVESIYRIACVVILDCLACCCCHSINSV